MTIQINSVTKSITSIANIEPATIGLIIAFVSGITIIGGVKKIPNTTSKLVPTMVILYFTICAYIIFKNYTLIPSILLDIISSALNTKSFGIGTLTTLLIGMQKGIFSSEVGLGTGSIATAVADSDIPAQNGIAQIFEIHFENLIIATITTLVVCMSNYQNIMLTDPNGIEITLQAFNYHLGYFGVLFIAIIISLFGLATILTGYYYGESSFKFLKKTNKFDIFVLKFITILIIFWGSIASSKLLWSITDILVGILAIINIYAIFSLRKIVIEEYKGWQK